MGFFDLFKKPAKIIDPDFGELTADYHFLINENFYFPPSGKSIVLIINCDKEPSTWQRDFYREIEHKYPDLPSKIKPLMENLFRNWEEGFVIKDFESEFLIYSISIPAVAATPLIWEMTFKSINDRNHDFNITFRDFEPESEIMVDG